MAKESDFSPFFSRAYGGYTLKQVAFYEEAIGDPKGKRILDPMAGQGFAISKLANRGATVCLGDINPAPLLLAALRDPRIVANRQELTGWLEAIIKKLMAKRRRKPKDVVVADWLSPSIKLDLDELSKIIGIGLFPKMFSSQFWLNENEIRFAVAIIVLAARKFVCYRKSDNLTWLKPGGIAREVRLGPAIREALTRWNSWADDLGASICHRQGGELIVHSMNLENGEIPFKRKFDAIVTSPPYANRLDYTRLWAPETSVISHLCGASIDNIKSTLIGTTCVTGTDEYEKSFRSLPQIVKKSLQEIKLDPTKYSESYYYPFFRNYAVSLMRGMQHASEKLKKHGTMIVIIRDTVRKDVMFPSGELVKSVLTRKNIGLKHVNSEKVVIKGHIGNVRKTATSGVYGMAQLEWWMKFQKSG